MGRDGRPGGATERLRHVVPAVALAVLVVVWWATRFVGHGTLRALDDLLHFVPTYAATWERLRAGRVPLWNPYHLCGLPWIGTLQGGTFYPSHVLYALLPLNVALALGGIGHLVIAALATAAFARRLGLGLAAAFLAAVVFALRGHVAAGLVDSHYIEAVAWLPVGACALVDLARGPAPRAIALFAAAVGLSFLAGYPQVSVYFVYAWGSLFLALLLHERPSRGGGAMRIVGFAVALGLGFMVAAVQILPAVELLSVGTRSAHGHTDQTMFLYGPDVSVGLRTVRFQSIMGALPAFGLIALMLVPAALLAPQRRILGWWAVVVSALGAAWSLGRHTPLFDLYLALPGLRLFREPGRLLIVTDFGVAVAAALGLGALVGDTRADARPARDRSRSIAVALAAIALVLLAELIRNGWAPNASRVVVVPVLVVAGASIVAWLVLGAERRRALAVAVCAVAAIEIAANPWGDFKLPYEAADLAPYRKLDKDLRALALLAGHDRVWRVFTGINVEQTLKLCTWYRVRSFTDYEPVNLHRQSDYMTYLQDGSTVAKRFPWVFGGDISTVDPPPGGTSLATRRRLLDLAAVRWITVARVASNLPTLRQFADDAHLVRHATTDELVILENRAALPRAFVTYGARPAPDDADALLEKLSADAFDPLVESYVEGRVPSLDATDPPLRGHAATFVRDDETDVELEATLERPGLLVLADSFYPGWHATVDGAPVPIVATNHLFRGVPVPAGTHRVRFVYAPASVGIGAALSAVGLLVIVLLARRRV